MYHDKENIWEDLPTQVPESPGIVINASPTKALEYSNYEYFIPWTKRSGITGEIQDYAVRITVKEKSYGWKLIFRIFDAASGSTRTEYSRMTTAGKYAFQVGGDYIHVLFSSDTGRKPKCQWKIIASATDKVLASGVF